MKSIAPAEGSTGWSDTWMINSKTKHVNCAYLWLQHITSPEVNIQVAEWFGEAPANSKACALSTVEGHCDLYHATDEAYWSKVWYWSTPEDDLPRRPHGRQVQGLRRLDQRLDRDQGLIAAVAARRSVAAAPAALRAAHPTDRRRDTRRASTCPRRAGRAARGCARTAPARAARAAPRPARSAGWAWPTWARCAILFLNAFWSRDAFTGQIIRQFTLENFVELLTTEVYRAITLRTLVDGGGRHRSPARSSPSRSRTTWRASRRRAVRGLLVVAVLMPLWASYLVKVYAWRLIIAEDGVLNWLIEPLGLKFPGPGDLAVYLVFVYLWLPYMILPIFAGLERIPGSLLEASADLGARSGMTFRRVVLPLALPGGGRRLDLHVLADAGRLHRARAWCRRPSSSATSILVQVGPAGNLPFAAAYAMVPAGDHARRTCWSPGAWAPSRPCDAPAAGPGSRCASRRSRRSRSSTCRSR